MPPSSPAFSTRFLALVALGWGALVWLNWLPGNPVEPWRVGRALASFGEIRAGPAVVAWGGHLRLILLAVLLAAAALGAGAPAVRWLAGPRRRSGFLRLAAGSGFLGLAVLGAGCAGLAFAGPARLAVVAAALVARPWRWRIPAGWLGEPGIAWPVAVLALALWPALLGALAPEVSFDALAHHLAHPETYRAAHKVIALPHHFLTHYPALLEMQYLLASLVAGDVRCAKLVHFGWGLVVLAALAGWARGHMEARWAMAAAAGFSVLPYVQTVFMWAYVDLGAAAYFTAAVLAAAGPTPAPALAGVLAGCCAGTKATGVFAPILVGAMLTRRGRTLTGPDPAGRGLVGFAAAAALIAAPWGIKNLFYTGNPFAPFLAGWFPTLWWDPTNQARYAHELRSYEADAASAGPGWLRLLAQPWLTGVRNFGVLDQQSGMSVFFLWAFPLLLLTRESAGALPARLALGWFVLWLFVPRQIRYLLPAWPAAAVAATVAVRALARRGGLAAIPAWIAGALLAYHLAWAYQREHFVINPVRVVFGLETPEAYLTRGLPAKPYSIRVIRWMHGAMPDRRVAVVSHYGMNLHWGPRAVAQSVFDTPLIERFARESGSPARLRVRFREAGLDRVLYTSVGGFTMHAVYGMYGFDPASAVRWRAFWSRYAELVHNQDDQFFIFALRPRPGPVARMSAVPGVDEQAVGALDQEIVRAEQDGSLPGLLPRVEADYRRIAAAQGNACAWERVGTTALRAGRWAPAAEALRHAVALGRDTAVLHDALGVLESKEGRMADAIREFKKSLALRPDLDDARRNLVNLLWSLDQRGAALAVIREGLAQDPPSAVMGELYMRYTGRPPEAGP